MTVFVAQHPLEEFFDAWDQLEVSRRLGQSEGTGPVSMEAFFGDFGSSVTQRTAGGWFARLRTALKAAPLKETDPALKSTAKHGVCGQLLVNRLACRLGLDYDADPGQGNTERVAQAWCVVRVLGLRWQTRWIAHWALRIEDCLVGIGHWAFALHVATGRGSLRAHQCRPFSSRHCLSVCLSVCVLRCCLFALMQ